MSAWSRRARMKRLRRWLAGALGFSQPPIPQKQVYEDPDRLGYTMMAGGAGTPEPAIRDREAREFLKWVETL
jgi:hypothetical protein